MNVDRSTYYASMWEARQRDPVAILGPAAVPMSRGWAMYRRFNPMAELIYVGVIEGKERWITRKQADVLDLATSLIDMNTTMREMAATLKVSTSTVSRAMVKLASYGLIGYLVSRGRYAGLTIFARVKGDGLDRFTKLAKAKVIEWKKAAERRLSRLQSNVAPYLSERKMGVQLDSLYYYLTTVDKSATLTAQLPWTAEDMAEIV